MAWGCSQKAFIFFKYGWCALDRKLRKLNNDAANTGCSAVVGTFLRWVAAPCGCIRRVAQQSSPTIPPLTSPTGHVSIQDNGEGRRLGTLVVWLDDGVASDEPILAVPINLSVLLDLPQDQVRVLETMGWNTGRGAAVLLCYLLLWKILHKNRSCSARSRLSSACKPRHPFAIHPHGCIRG